MRGITPSLILSGQHQELSLCDYGLGHFPSMKLDCPGEENPHAHVGKVTAALLSQLRTPPDLLVVQGDTSSALGAALAGFTSRVRVAHVEAGLRSHDPMLPWPEEEYRIAIDAQADLLFAPTETARANLLAESVPGEVHVTGNTGIDALLAMEATLPPRDPRKRDTKTVLVTFHRRESWGDGLASIALALKELAAAADLRIIFVLHPNPHVAKSMGYLLGDHPRIELIAPLSHRELVVWMRDADLVLSDSGGIQEEAPALGVPLLVLREKTERPEGIAAGNALLVGTSTEAIVDTARRLLSDPEERAAMARRTFPYGDGRAAPRIAEITHQWLDEASPRAAS